MKAGVTQTAALLEELKAKGVSINPVDKSGFIKLAMPLQDEEAKEMGLTGVLKILRDTK
jgi:TRAP-type C4-dicarboxylate transport system substrate-binding protein